MCLLRHAPPPNEHGWLVTPLGGYNLTSRDTKEQLNTMELWLIAPLVTYIAQWMAAPWR